MQDHLSTNQIVLITKNFIFENFILKNFIFRKFCQILFDFISFLFNLKKKNSKNFVMNSVHEPGSRTMSKNLTPEKYRVKPGQKQAECTKCTALASLPAQAAHLGHPPAAPPPRALVPPAPHGPVSLLPRAPATPVVCAPRVPSACPASTAYCNTQQCIAIQFFFFSEYNLGSSPKTVLHQQIFFSIPLISSYWKNSEKYLYIYIFFHFSKILK